MNTPVGGIGIARLLGRAVRGLLAAVLLAALVAGLPWALIHGVGWPLPDHLPSLDEIGSVLMAPMTSKFLLDAIACLAWLLWLMFVIDVAACTLDVARGARWPDLRIQSGPVRRVATVLVGTLLIAVLGRTATAAPTPAGHAPIVAAAVHQPVPESATERVRAPEAGVHDSLWRIAQRRLGDGNRWPEIWTLNQGSTQPGGRLLTNPDLIHPGDLLRLPQSTPPAPPESASGTPAPPTSLVSPVPSTMPAADSGSRSKPADDATWGSSETFVSLGLAAAVSALLVLARRRHNARYRPGSGRRDQLPVAPVVYQLRLAHLRTQHDEDTELDTESAEPAAPIEHRVRVVGGAGPEDSSSVVDIGLDVPLQGEGTQVALDLARVHGLGLVGPGAYAAARALLLTLLTARRDDGPAPAVLVPAADLNRLLGVPVPPADLPDTVTVVSDLDTALAALESDNPPRGCTLVATPPTEAGQQERLRHLLDDHAQHGLTALLLGQWRPGVTAYVTAGGVISATDPGLGEPLRGTRAFTLPETATRDLLTFLRTAQAPAEDSSLNHDSDHLEITAEPPVQPPPEEGAPEPPPTAVAQSENATAALMLTVFGAPALHWRPDPTRLQDLSAELSGRLTELLVFLALHPGGASRDAIIDALWSHRPPRNPASVLRTILSRIRRALDTATGGAVGELVLAEHGHYRLDPAIVQVDYWAFADAVTRRRTATTPEQRINAYEAIVAHYGGFLAEGLRAEWLAAAREATRRDALDAVAALARARVETDPDYTLDLLETARAFDPHNELLYRDIMRLQHKLGRHDAISRTLTLLHTRLAEIDNEPTPDTINLAQRLRARHTGIPLDGPSRAPANE
ncbi:BTAD domain-containing putative transcriptional regulator [Amycolatopsis sp. NPDC006125]|uniref:BTAD domain-containing putative transcriptional regulator n=1 Tax=Amycolatopsis sp. NPDC006125 TaxID=3156730 RepID=UPI00339F6F02